jgi:hypothetical protein
MTTTAQTEYDAAEALALLLRNLDPEGQAEAGLLPVTYQDWVANTVVFAFNGTTFHAVVTAA